MPYFTLQGILYLSKILSKSIDESLFTISKYNIKFIAKIIIFLNKKHLDIKKR